MLNSSIVLWEITAGYQSQRHRYYVTIVVTIVVRRQRGEDTSPRREYGWSSMWKVWHTVPHSGCSPQHSRLEICQCRVLVDIWIKAKENNITVVWILQLCACLNSHTSTPDGLENDGNFTFEYLDAVALHSIYCHINCQLTIACAMKTHLQLQLAALQMNWVWSILRVHEIIETETALVPSVHWCYLDQEKFIWKLMDEKERFLGVSSGDMMVSTGLQVTREGAIG